MEEIKNGQSTLFHQVKGSHLTSLGQQKCLQKWGGSILREKTQKDEKEKSRVLPLSTSAQMMKNENKIYFHTLNNITWKPWKFGIKTPIFRKTRKPGKRRNWRYCL